MLTGDRRGAYRHVSAFFCNDREVVVMVVLGVGWGVDSCSS